MREALRGVSALIAGFRIDLLGEQPDIIAALDQPLERGLGLGGAAVEGKAAHAPEGAGREGALVTVEAVIHAVAIDQVAAPQLPLDGREGRARARILRI